MICDVCGQAFVVKATFSGLFRPPRRCLRCQRRYAFDTFLECIPIPLGMVRYQYALSEENDDYHLSVLLADGLARLFLQADGWVLSGAAVVLLDLREMADFATWFPFVANFRDVRFFSLFYIDLEPYGELF